MRTELRLHVGLQNKKSVITDSFFTSPLKLGVPNTEGERLKVVLMMASAGILKGDEFVYDICCGSGTKTLLTEQSYTKIFDTGDGGAKRRQHIQVEQGASLYYCPCAAIPFGGSTYSGDMTVRLEEGSEFAYADIVAAGRVGMGERFAFRQYKNRICVELGDIPVWLDHCMFRPDRLDLESLVFFDGHTHQGTFYYYGKKEKQQQFLDWYLGKQEEIEKTAACGVTEAREGICLRALADTAQDIEELFGQIAEVLELWK